jgi:hypothetical protein
MRRGVCRRRRENIIFLLLKTVWALGGSIQLIRVDALPPLQEGSQKKCEEKYF